MIPLVGTGMVWLMGTGMLPLLSTEIVQLRPLGRSNQLALRCSH